MKTKVKETVEQFLRDVTPYNRQDEHIQFKEDETFLRWNFYTDEHCFSVVATFDKPTIQENYFGCTATTRKPRAGETWNRGNDLPDGKLTQKTWQAIKNAIIRYDIVKLSPAIKYHVDEVEKPVIGIVKE